MAFKNKTTCLTKHQNDVFNFSLIYSVVLSLSISYVHLFLSGQMTQHIKVFAPMPDNLSRKREVTPTS